MLTKLELDALTTPGRYLAGGVPGLYVQVSLGKDGQPRRSLRLSDTKSPVVRAKLV